MKKAIRILTILFYVIISSLSFFFVRCSILFIKQNELIDINPSLNSLIGKTKIMEFKDPASRHIENGGESMSVHFVVSNPPKNEDSLLSLVSKHFQSFAPYDTIKKYKYYYHKYYKETWITRHDYKKPKEESFYDYLSNRGNDLLVTIDVNTVCNKQEIMFYKKGYKEKRIGRTWRE